MKTVTLPGPVTSPKPMNPASRVWPDHNPHVIAIRSGAWIHRFHE